MAAKFRPILSLFALLLTVLPLAGLALPTPGLWQCRHAAQWVAAVPAPNAMPCRMSGRPMTMAAMPCCAKRLRVSHTATTGRQTVGAAPCRPTFVPTAVLPTARLGADGPRLSHSAPSEVAALPPFTPERWQASHLAVDRQRPPPEDAPPPSDLFRLPPFRAPPAA